MEFEPWEGGPRTAVKLKVRAALLRPVSPATSGAESYAPLAGNVCISRASTSESAATSPSPAPAGSPAQEAFPAAFAGSTPEAWTRKAARDMGGSPAAASAGCAGAQAEGSEDGEGESAGRGESEEIDEEMNLNREGNVSKEVREGSDREKGRMDGEEETEKKRGQGGKGSRAGRGRAGAEDKSVDDSKEPPFIAVGSRVILKRAYNGKHTPRGPFVNPHQLVGKTVRDVAAPSRG